MSHAQKSFRFSALSFAFLFVLAFSSNASSQVTVTGSTGANATYTELNLAFTAINGAGTQAGNNINVAITANTTETASATLTAGDWATLTVRPDAAGRIIEGTIVGAVIRLDGADNVTIDGRVGGVGTARDLTVRNNSTAAATAAIWLSSVVAGNGATNNVVRNLEIAAGATQNTLTVSTFGIIMSGTTISTTANGLDNDDNQFIFNRIIRVRYGIVTRGTTTDLSIAPIVTDNIIGPAAFGADQIGRTGILMQADTGATVSRNTVQFVGVITGQTPGFSDRTGIGIGTDSWSATDTTTLTSNSYTVTRNFIHDIVEEKTGSAIGIKLGTAQSGGATNNLVANNFIYNIRSNGTFGDQLCGIGIAGGNGDRIVFNSISLTGDQDPAGSTATSVYGNAIRIPGANGTNNANFSIQNNSIYLDVNSNTTTLPFFAITLNSTAYSFGTGALNYNNYYITQANAQLFTAGFSATSTAPTAALSFKTLADFVAGYPGQNANSIQADPLYFSNTGDLHIPTNSPNVNVATPIAGVTDDIDGQARPNGPTPDIGADEAFASAGTVQLGSTAFSVSESAGTVNITVTRSGGNNGAATVDYTFGGGTATGGAACTAGVDYINTPGTVNFADLGPTTQNITVTICADGVFEGTETFNVTLSNATTATLGTPTVATVSIFDAGSTFNGTVNVGAGETVTSLTNPGGIFQGINNGVVTGNVTINITSDLAGETGSVALNEIPGGFTVTIKPSGAARTITGTTGGSSIGLIGFNGADNVTIDGSLSGGGSDRSLTINNTIASNTGAGIYFSSGATGAQNNTVRSVNVFGAGSTLGSLLGIGFGGNTFGAAGTDNDNNRVLNNDIRGAFYGLFSGGVSAANPNTGNIFVDNVMPGLGTAGIGRIGIYAFFEDGMTITGNNIASVASALGLDNIGIALGTQAVTTTPGTPSGVTNTLVSRNYIGTVSNTATFSSIGILLGSGATGTNRVDTNMVAGVLGNSTPGDFVAGIYVAPAAGAAQNIYYNSVSMTGDRGTTAGQTPSYALAIATDQPVNVVNNILYNTQTRTGSTGTGGESYAFGFDGPAANVNLTATNNDLFVSGPLGVIGITGDLTTAAQTGSAGTGTNQLTLADLQTATSDFAASISADPLFVSSTDLHIQPTSPVQDLGVPIASVLLDFDLQMRAQPPLGGGTTDIGADEILAPTAAQATLSGRVTTANGAGIRNAIISISGGDLPQTRFSRTGSFGYYAFEDLTVGETYIVIVQSKRYTFTVPTRVIQVNDNVDGVDFIAEQ